MKKILSSQRGIVKTFPILIVVATVGIISFLLISSTAPFNGNFFSKLFNKPSSNAATGTVISTDWAQVQKDPQRTGYSSEQINPPYTIKWKWNTDQTNPVRLSHLAQPITAYGKM